MSAPAPGTSCGCTSAPRPASARPSPCSTRAGAATSAAPTWWSGFVETHRRPKTEAQLRDLEVVPRTGSTTGARRSRRWTSTPSSPADPAVVLVDELAHTNVPGSEQEKRWQDVDELLDAGIDVITTVNIQHLESLNDVIERITGVHQRETVPDAVVRRADQIELVDMSPEALRRRMAHGNIYPPERRRRRSRQLLPTGQPGRAAGAGPAVGRRSGRGEPPDVHGEPRHRRRVGDPRAGRGGGHGRARAVSSSSGGRPASPGVCGAGSSACTSCRRTGSRPGPGRSSPGSGPCWASSAAATGRSSGNGCPAPSWSSLAARRRRRSSWAPAGAAGGKSCCAARSWRGSSVRRRGSTST